MPIYRISYKQSLLLLFCLTLVLGGCMPSKIKDQIDETEKENEKLKDEVKNKDQSDTEVVVEDVEVTDEQREVLDSLETVSPEEALKENELPVRTEEKIQVPADKKSFTNHSEFSQYVSSLLYLYHKGDLDAETFYQKISPHFHENFINMLPAEKKEQIETFKLLQKAFMQQLSKPIVKYALTDSVIRERADEAGFFRKYELSNGEFIYYQTIIKQQEGKWLLYDDSPAPPYLITPNQNFKEQEGGNTSE